MDRGLIICERQNSKLEPKQPLPNRWIQQQEEIKIDCFSLLYSEELYHKCFTILKQHQFKYKQLKLLLELKQMQKLFRYKFLAFQQLKQNLAKKNLQIQNDKKAKGYYLKKIFNSFKRVVCYNFSLRLKRLNLQQYLSRSNISHMIENYKFLKIKQKNYKIQQLKAISSLRKKNVFKKIIRALTTNKNLSATIKKTKRQFCHSIYKNFVQKKCLNQLKVNLMQKKINN